jgi:ribosomal protein S18 acetylase RimI-like enzyme
VSTVAHMHAEELASSFLGELGAGFLEKLYGYLCHDPAFACWLAERDARVVGYLASTMDTDGFYGRVYRRHFAPLAMSVALRALRRPSLAWRAVGVLTSHTPETRQPGDRAELLSIAVRASERGTGAGRKLVAMLTQELVARGQRTCSVVVAEGIEAHRFYRAVGFVETDRFHLHGDPCSVYLLDVSGGSPGGAAGTAAPRARATSAIATTTTSSSK